MRNVKLQLIGQAIRALDLGTGEEAGVIVLREQAEPDAYAAARLTDLGLYADPAENICFPAIVRAQGARMSIRWYYRSLLTLERCEGNLGFWGERVTAVRDEISRILCQVDAESLSPGGGR